MVTDAVLPLVRDDETTHPREMHRSLKEEDRKRGASHHNVGRQQAL